MENKMDETPSRTGKPGLLRASRLVLLASAAGLGSAVLFAAPATLPNLPNLTAPAHAQTALRPASFADIVERVKPAVISVRVKIGGSDAAAADDGDTPFPPGSPME